MTKRILLHIGTHKTGTSALQRVFETERQKLAAAGIWYPSTDREPYPQLPKHTSLWAATTNTEAFAEEFRFMWEEAQAAGCETLLISEEGFSGPSPERFSVFAGLQDFEIDVFVTLRRQDQFLESLWNQRVKLGRESRSVADFVQAEDIRIRANYVRILDYWAGIGKVHPTEYETAKKRGIVAQFCDVAGLPLLRDAGYNNPSLGMNEALIRSWFIARDLTFPRALQEAMQGDLRRQALGSVLRKELRAQYRKSNEDLAARYGITFPDDMPEEGPDPLTSPDPDVLVSLLNYLTTPRKDASKTLPAVADVGVYDLRDAANALRNSHPKLALRLAHAALSLRPSGKAIQALVDGLEGRKRNPDKPTS